LTQRPKVTPDQIYESAWPGYVKRKSSSVWVRVDTTKEEEKKRAIRQYPNTSVSYASQQLKAINPRPEPSTCRTPMLGRLARNSRPPLSLVETAQSGTPEQAYTNHLQLFLSPPSFSSCVSRRPTQARPKHYAIRSVSKLQFGLDGGKSRLYDPPHISNKGKFIRPGLRGSILSDCFLLTPRAVHSKAKEASEIIL